MLGNTFPSSSIPSAVSPALLGPEAPGRMGWGSHQHLEHEISGRKRLQGSVRWGWGLSWEFMEILHKLHDP